MRCIKHFEESIPVEKREFVLEKMSCFEKALIEARTFTKLQKGFWVRRVKGTNIYKFRVNNGDRVLFQYDDTKPNDTEIIFLEYSKHDDQIRKGKSFDKVNCNWETYEIETEIYQEDEIDEQIDYYIIKEYYNRFRTDSILEDEYIPLLIEDDLLSDKVYLTENQFKCIDEKSKSGIVFGCAGSGKTMIGVRKLLMNQQMGIKTAYITSSKRIKDSAKKLYSSMTEDKKDIYFYTIQELYMEILKMDDSFYVTYSSFKAWAKNSDFKRLEGLSILDIWNEISSVIKGLAPFNKNLMDKNEYISSIKSNLSSEQKKKVYGVAIAYNNWLKNRGYYDQNDLLALANSSLTEPLFDSIVYDEFQELNMRTVLFLGAICSKKDNFLILGDKNQRINNIYDNTEIVKEQLSGYFAVYTLSRNYRNGEGVVKWINRLKSIKKSLGYQSDNLSIICEEAVREGVIPSFVESIRKKDRLFEKISDDTTSIIIVGDEEEKESLLKEGLNIERVFTVEESRGLEYKTVYCHNMLKYVQKSSKLNSLYVAASRCKNELVFIEDKETELQRLFDGYYLSIDEHNLLGNIHKETSSNEWLKEAKHLEAMEKYEQAIVAYEKAGDAKRASLCKKALDRQTSYIYLREQNQFIDIHGDNIEAKNIEKVLYELRLLEQIPISGWIEITTYHKTGNLPKTRSIYIDDTSNIFEFAQSISNCIFIGSFSKQHITINWACSKNNMDKDYLVSINSGHIRMESVYCIEAREREKFKNQAMMSQDILVRRHIRILENEESIYSQSTENILKNIFDT